MLLAHPSIELTFFVPPIQRCMIAQNWDAETDSQKIFSATLKALHKIIVKKMRLTIYFLANFICNFDYGQWITSSSTINGKRITQNTADFVERRVPFDVAQHDYVNGFGDKVTAGKLGSTLILTSVVFLDFDENQRAFDSIIFPLSLR